MQAAKSFVMKPDSIVSTQTASKHSAKLPNSLLLSNFARCSNPRVHANMDANVINLNFYDYLTSNY